MTRHPDSTTPRKEGNTVNISTYHADVTDPVTGETTTLSATSADELEQTIAEHLAVGYPAPVSTA